MKQIKRLGVGQCTKVALVLYLLIGVIVAICMSVVSAIGSGIGLWISMYMIILTPLVYAAVGSVGTAIFCLLYNFVASKVGGFAIETEG